MYPSGGGNFKADVVFDIEDRCLARRGCWYGLIEFYTHLFFAVEVNFARLAFMIVSYFNQCIERIGGLVDKPIDIFYDHFFTQELFLWSQDDFIIQGIDPGNINGFAHSDP